MDSQKKRDTLLLIESAYKGESLDKMLKEIKASRKLNQILLPKMARMNMSNEVLADLVGCSRAYVYGIMNGKKLPEKDMLLRIAFVLGMNVDETQEMLKTARRASLSSINERDICIIFGLAKELDLDTMDEVLIEKNQKPLAITTKEEARLVDIISFYLEKVDMDTTDLLHQVKCSERLYQDLVDEQVFAPRDLLIRMAFVLKMSLTDLQSMLKIERLPIMAVKNMRDMFIMNGLANGISAAEMDKRLVAQGEAPLWEKSYDLPLRPED